jgi:mono/diheme cytochrome c family protein
MSAGRVRSSASLAMLLGLAVGWGWAQEDVAPPVGDEVPTFCRDIAPIIFANCTSCHRSGEIGPFPMTTYAEVKRKAKMIAEVTGTRRMPPWKAEPGFGDFADARRLDDPQIALLKRWVAGGAPEGDVATLPPLPVFPQGWQLGTPDLILTMPEAYQLPAEGRDVYRCFVLPTSLPEDSYVKAVEFHPGTRSIVHHAIFYLDTSGRARQLDEQDPGPGYTHFGGPGFVPSGGLGGWAPGARPRPLPDGVARPLRQGTDVVIQIHYHLSGKPESDRSSIGLYLTKERPKRIMLPFVVGSHAIDIAPGEHDYVIRQQAELPADATVVGLTPHAHLLAREMKADAILPDGSVQHLIWIKDWDFNWQEQYRYQTPLHLPAHTRIEMEYHYDNSSDNDRNPNVPPKRVTFGEQTTDEMSILFVNIIPDRFLDIPKFLRAMASSRRSVAVPAP